ncbi:MAG TPA: thiamine phosphate synthase, partial [Hyphomonadaceae bacterium]|nr:thiamine phosphate synthase [Hyphomonadaceae bacterium]
MALSQPVTPQAQAVIRRKLLAAARLAKPARARNGRPLPRAWFLTDPRRTPHPERIVEALPAGFGVVYRHYGSTDRFETGARLAAICRRRRLTLLVSADPELAQRINADGIHWPEAKLRGVRARSLRWIETAAAHSPRALVRARALGVDAVILSAVFASASPSAGAPMGALRFRARTRRS